MTTSLLLFSSRYENFLIVVENWRRINVKCQNFCQIDDFKNLTNLTKYYKNPEIPTYINLILTNKPKYFQNSITIETGLSDFHKMTTTVLKTYFKNQNPKLFIESASFVLWKISISTQKRFTTKWQEPETFSRFLSPSFEFFCTIEDKICL